MTDWYVMCIRFYGDPHKMEKLIGKFTELEYKGSVQVMGDVLDVNSYESEEINRFNFGISNDFGLCQCKLNMETDTVLIYLDGIRWSEPTEFLAKVCAKYKVMGKIEIDDEVMIQSNSQGNHTNLEFSDENEQWYSRDQLGFLNDARCKIRTNIYSGWDEVKNTYYFVSMEDLVNMEKVYNEVNVDRLFQPDFDVPLSCFD